VPVQPSAEGALARGGQAPRLLHLFIIDPPKESLMNWDRIEGNWRQIKGKAKEQWGKLTDDEFDRIAGKRDQLVGRIQETYGISRDEADKQVRDWETRLQ
jgi:uncharacterized protein YjbJ (UPF0337 family)